MTIAAKARCPNCGRPPADEYRPFCSKRCADVDLGRWLGGAYRIPGPPAAPDDIADGGDEKDGDEGEK